MRIDPNETPTAQLHGYLLGSVAPRPIAFVSTVNEDGVRNLSPFSFFNVFSANPPIAIFSPARRVRDNTTKHTLKNAIATKECVINVVSYDIVQQMSLSSTEYGDGVDEFTKSGLTPIESEIVSAARVAESPVQMECKVKEVIQLGTEGGAGNLVICQVVMMHIDDRILGDDGKIDQHKIDLVSRLGANWYGRATGSSLFEVPKPLSTLGIGVDALPEGIRNSTILTGNDLGQLGNVEAIPSLSSSIDLTEKLNTFSSEHVHQMAHDLIENGNLEEAWQILLTKTESH
jgi:flavin reductase (DIM6/NTAB) family NADH-FMN oxidoreductase RutF